MLARCRFFLCLIQGNCAKYGWIHIIKQIWNIIEYYTLGFGNKCYKIEHQFALKKHCLLQTSPITQSPNTI